MDLEDHHGLDAENEAHIWLLHFLFLQAINRDIHAWQEAWNMHYINTPERGNHSPREMFLFGMHQYGPRGIDAALEDQQFQVHLPSFGVNWLDRAMAGRSLDREAREGRRLAQPLDPFVHPSTPERLSVVVCDEPQGPFTREQVTWLEAQLIARVDGWSQNMEERNNMWNEALQLTHQVFQSTE